MATRRLLALVLVLIATDASAQVTVRDDMDRTIFQRMPATRIVALTDFLADVVTVAGAGSRLVAVGGPNDVDARVMGTSSVAVGEKLSIARVLSFKPDLVLTSLDVIRPEDVDRLATAGVNVFIVRNISVEDPPRILRTVASLVGTDASATAAAYEEKLVRLRRDNFSKRGLKVFVELWHRPLKTVSANHFLSEALEICQTRNIFSDWKQPTSIITYEHAAVRDPDVIVGIASASNGEEFRANWSARATMRAVREKRLLFIYAESPQAPSLKTPIDVEQLCEGLDAIRSSFQ